MKPILNVFKHSSNLFLSVGDFSNQKRLALKNDADVSNFQPVNSDLRPFRETKDAAVQNQPSLKLKSAVCAICAIHWIPPDHSG